MDDPFHPFPLQKSMIAPDGVSFREASLAPKFANASIAIIEPNSAKAELLQYFCTSYWGFEVVALKSTATAGVTAVAQARPDLILAAITPADLALGDFVVRLRAAAPASKLILLSTQCNEFLLHTLSRTEYHGLIYEPDESLSAIGHAIEHVRCGYRFISTRMAACQAGLRAAPLAFPKLLSKREQEVLSCIAHSLSDEEIGRKLGCSEGTALSHRRTLMRKLGIHSTPKLIRYCADKGFNSIPPWDRR